MRDNYRHRSLYIRLFVVIGALILIGQLINLQIIKDYGEQADDNAFLRKTIYAMRGLIYDRNGKLLVFNQPIYDIDIIVKQWDDLKKQDTPVDTTELCRVLGIEKSDFIERLDNLKDKNKNINYSPILPQKLITQLTPEEAAVIQEVIWKFPGISLVSRTMRQYTTPYASHAIGSIGEVSKAILKKYEDEYKQGDYIGVSGVEKQYEDILKGKNGLEIFLRDVKGRIQGKYKNGKEDVARRRQIVDTEYRHRFTGVWRDAYAEQSRQHSGYRTVYGRNPRTCVVAELRPVRPYRQATQPKLRKTPQRPIQTAPRPPNDGILPSGQYFQDSQCSRIRTSENNRQRHTFRLPFGLYRR